MFGRLAMRFANVRAGTRVLIYTRRRSNAILPGLEARPHQSMVNDDTRSDDRGHEEDTRTATRYPPSHRDGSIDISRDSTVRREEEEEQHLEREREREQAQRGRQEREDSAAWDALAQARPAPKPSVLGSWVLVGVRRPFQLSLCLTASRMVIPKILVLRTARRGMRSRSGNARRTSWRRSGGGRMLRAWTRPRVARCSKSAVGGKKKRRPLARGGALGC